MRRSSLTILSFLLLATACSASDQKAGPAPAPASQDAVGALNIRNARRPTPQLLTGGQIDPDQMTALRDLGFGTFINLRTAEEDGTGWEEEFAEQSGITYHRLPVAGASGITVENAEQLASWMREAGDEPIVVYCGSGNRVGALLALKAHFVDGAPAEEALQLGLDAGLTRLEPTVREALGLPPE